jgi:hypothetical protein
VGPADLDERRDGPLEMRRLVAACSAEAAGLAAVMLTSVTHDVSKEGP